MVNYIYIAKYCPSRALILIQNGRLDIQASGTNGLNKIVLVYLAKI